MPNMQEKIAHAATVAKWKVDQQLRINSSQVKEKTIEGQIGGAKVRLSEEAYTLFTQNNLSEASLIEICQQIEGFYASLKAQQAETEAIKREFPPALPQEPVNAGGYPAPAASSSGLICPICKKPVPVRFCPEHGVEGVPPTSE
jgi:hypothetical protein